MRGRFTLSIPIGICTLLVAQLALPARALVPPTTASLAASLDPRVQEWIGDPFVQRALGSSDFAELEAQLHALDGYLGVYPETSGTYVAHWEGQVPAEAPRRSPEGYDVRHVSNTRVEPLITRAAAETSPISLHDLERQMRVGSAQPMTPGPVQGIGPGGAIRMTKADATGRVFTYICSASYLFHNPATDTYFLGTAGHCLLDENVVASSDDPSGRARSIELCYADCVNNYVGLGKYVELRPGDAYPGYHPVAWAEQRGVGLDFGFIEIPRSLNSLLRPSLWFWGGPTGFKRPAIGTPIVHYGFGTGLGQATPTQGRAAITIVSSKTGGQAAIGWVNGGDSGSAFGTASPRPDEMLVGDGASGAITHAITGVGLPLMWGTDLENALDRSQSALGSRLVLVTENGMTQSPTPTPGPGSSPTPSPSPSSSPAPTPEPTPEPTPAPTPTPEPTPTSEPTPMATPTPTPEPTQTPAPTSSPAPSSEPSPSPTPDAPPNDEGPAERDVSLRSSRSIIEAGDPVRLRGSISSSAGCVVDQPVKVLARKRSQKKFRRIRQTTTASDGGFVVKLRPHATRSYRVVVPADEDCVKAMSRTVTVRVVR